MLDVRFWMLVKIEAQSASINKHPTSKIQHLFSNLSLHPVNDLLPKGRWDFFVLAEMHRKTSTPLRVGANIGGVAEHFRKRHHRLDDLGSAPQFHAFDAAPG